MPITPTIITSIALTPTELSGDADARSDLFSQRQQQCGESESSLRFSQERTLTVIRDINNTTFQQLPATVQAVGQFKTYALSTPITITSGDFVIGYKLTTGRSGRSRSSPRPTVVRIIQSNGVGFNLTTGTDYMIRGQYTTNCADAPATTISPGSQSFNAAGGNGSIAVYRVNRLDGDEQRRLDYDHFRRERHGQRLGRLFGHAKQHRRAAHRHNNRRRTNFHRYARRLRGRLFAVPQHDNWRSGGSV